MLVLDGPQGIGKSEFARWLASPMPDYFLEAPINTDDKDSEIRLMSYWIWEVSELGATTRKADYEALKAFLTTRKVTVRKPYGRHDIIKPALASFVGTINNSSGIFSDPTGSRRFILSKIEDISWDYSSELDPADVWAEAMAAYLAGETWKLTRDEFLKSQQINEEYDVADPIEDLVKKFFDLDVARDDWWIPTSDILAVLQDPTRGGLKGSTRGNAMGLAAVMTKLGHEKKRRNNNIGQQVWGYTGIRLHSNSPFNYP
jgi:predicted P-loop ATPase